MLQHLFLYFVPLNVCSDMYEQPVRMNVCCVVFVCVLKPEAWIFFFQGSKCHKREMINDEIVPDKIL